ncbi:MAG: nitrilase-related carbon-nitrogen hydrolase [Planctomycetota bacterium]
MTDEKPPLDFLGACVQFDVRRGDVSANLACAERHLQSAAEQGVKLAILPELWSTSFLPTWDEDVVREARQADERVLRLSQELDMVVVGSAVEADGCKRFNRVLVCDRGDVAASYRKIHLFTPNAEDRSMSPGSEPAAVDTSVGRLGLAVCYDLRFAELMRWFFYQHVEILVVPAQWPESRASHWRALIDARAIENQCFVLGCNRTGSEGSLKGTDQLAFPGNSRIVDPMGEVLASGQGDAGTVVAEIEPRKVRTMRRMMPIERDRRLELYPAWWAEAWSAPAVSRQTP